MSKKKRRTIAPLPQLPPGVRLVDSHCHLDFPDYQDDLAAVLDRAASAGVETVICPGIDLETSRRAVALAEENERVFAAVGVHPHHVAGLDEAVLTELRQLAAHPRVVAYGEIGLDYVKEYAPPVVQRRWFGRQLELAGELGLPLVIHDRQAHEDVLAFLRQAGPLAAGGVMHCFSGGPELARQVLELGWYLSVPGVVTFNKAEELQQAVRTCPLDRLLLETDGPFLAPVPRRGKRNEPMFLLYTAQRLAELKGISLGEVARRTTTNAERLFQLGGER